MQAAGDSPVTLFRRSDILQSSERYPTVAAQEELWERPQSAAGAAGGDGSSPFDQEKWEKEKWDDHQRGYQYGTQEELGAAAAVPDESLSDIVSHDGAGAQGGFDQREWEERVWPLLQQQQQPEAAAAYDDAVAFAVGDQRRGPLAPSFWLPQHTASREEGAQRWNAAAGSLGTTPAPLVGGGGGDFSSPWTEEGPSSLHNRPGPIFGGRNGADSLAVGGMSRSGFSPSALYHQRAPAESAAAEALLFSHRQSNGLEALLLPAQPKGASQLRHMTAGVSGGTTRTSWPPPSGLFGGMADYDLAGFSSPDAPAASKSRRFSSGIGGAMQHQLSLTGSPTPPLPTQHRQHYTGRDDSCALFGASTATPLPPLTATLRAGRASQNLDGPRPQPRAAPSSGRSPFGGGAASSGAILVVTLSDSDEEEPPAPAASGGGGPSAEPFGSLKVRSMLVRRGQSCSPLWIGGVSFKTCHPLQPPAKCKYCKTKPVAVRQYIYQDDDKTKPRIGVKSWRPECNTCKGGALPLLG